MWNFTTTRRWVIIPLRIIQFSLTQMVSLKVDPGKVRDVWYQRGRYFSESP
jgi:hypothetical protein